MTKDKRTTYVYCFLIVHTTAVLQSEGVNSVIQLFLVINLLGRNSGHQSFVNNGAVILVNKMFHWNNSLSANILFLKSEPASTCISHFPFSLCYANISKTTQAQTNSTLFMAWT